MTEQTVATDVSDVSDVSDISVMTEQTDATVPTVAAEPTILGHLLSSDSPLDARPTGWTSRPLDAGVMHVPRGTWAMGSWGHGLLGAGTGTYSPLVLGVLVPYRM
jgi:hypothetical protein